LKILRQLEIGLNFSILSYSFGCCTRLKRVFFNSPVTAQNMGYVFYNCISLESVDFGESVTMGSSWFYNCSNLKTVFGNYTNLGASTFGYCISLEEITILEGITTIPTSCFTYCASLSRVTVPKTVTQVGATSFNYCSNASIYDFTQHETVPKLANMNAFQNNLPQAYQILVPAALVEEWKAAANWSRYADNIVGV
jgi:hypothetical protein